MNINKNLEGGYYYPLFKYFSDAHDLTLLDDEIIGIISQVEKFKVSSHSVKDVKGNDVDIDDLIKKHLAWHPTELQMASAKYFVENGKVSGGFFMAIKKIAEEYSAAQVAPMNSVNDVEGEIYSIIHEEMMLARIEVATLFRKTLPSISDLVDSKMADLVDKTFNKIKAALKKI